MCVGFTVKMGYYWLCCCLELYVDSRKRRRRVSGLVMSKKRRRMLPYSPSEDPAVRLKQMASLATALTVTGTEYSNRLTYRAGMAPRHANCSDYERGGMQWEIRGKGENLKCTAKDIDKVRDEWAAHVLWFGDRHPLQA